MKPVVERPETILAIYISVLAKKVLWNSYTSVRFGSELPVDLIVLYTKFQRLVARRIAIEKEIYNNCIVMLLMSKRVDNLDAAHRVMSARYVRWWLLLHNS